MIVKIGFACAAALAVAACSTSSAVFDPDAYQGAFNKPFKAFEAPEWATARSDRNFQIGPTGPVAPEDMVAADGRCGPEIVQAAPAAAAPAPQPVPAAPDPAEPPPDRPVGSIAGDLASAPMPPGAAPVRPVSAPPPDRLEPEALPGAPAGPAFTGGVALGMTECQVVRRAGLPNNVNIGADERGERKVVLSYLSGNLPGIYQFQSGRLKEIAAAPVLEKPAKPLKKNPKKKPAQAKSANRDVNRAFVQ